MMLSNAWLHQGKSGMAKCTNECSTAMRQEMDAAVKAQTETEDSQHNASLMFCLPVQFFGLVTLTVQMQALDQELKGVQLRCLQRFATLTQACYQTADALQC